MAVFGLNSPYFSRSIIFPAIIKPANSAFWVSEGVWVMKLCTLLSINIFNYLFELYMPNYTKCATKGSIFEKN